MSRKARFRAALGLARMTATDFAAMNLVTPGHLSHVLSGKRDSAKLDAAIDSFISRYLPAQKEGAA